MSDRSEVPIYVTIAQSSPYDHQGRVFTGAVTGVEVGITLESNEDAVSFSSPFSDGESVVSFKKHGLLAINIVKNAKGVYIYGSYEPGASIAPTCTTCCGQTVCGGGHTCNGQDCGDS